MDVLAFGSDEGRSRLRKASVSCQRTLSRGYPNRATDHAGGMVSALEKIGCGGERGELKHLSNLRKRKKTRLP